jgi:hypothetical protein
LRGLGSRDPLGLQSPGPGDLGPQAQHTGPPQGLSVLRTPAAQGIMGVPKKKKFFSGLCPWSPQGTGGLPPTASRGVPLRGTHTTASSQCWPASSPNRLQAKQGAGRLRLRTWDSKPQPPPGMGPPPRSTGYREVPSPDLAALRPRRNQRVDHTSLPGTGSQESYPLQGICRGGFTPKGAQPPLCQGYP